MKIDSSSGTPIACTTSNLEADEKTESKDAQKPSENTKKVEDEWLGVTNGSTRRIGDSPYYLSRVGNASVGENHEKRLNRLGYDMDDPQDAMKKYEAAHPRSSLSKAWDWFSGALFDAFTFCLPRALSMSAGASKQRIDQKEVLRIVRESVDKFPELKIRVIKEKFDLLSSEDQIVWHEKMNIIRAAQHDYIVNELAKVYPNHIDQDAPTILYTGGRATGLLRVLYGSVDEYIALYWSDWGLMSTDSGSYNAHVYDYITEGENKNWNARYLDYNAHDFEVTGPGEYTFLGKGDRKIWSFEGPCGMVDHGIGNVPSMMKFAIVSNFTSTLNMREVGRLFNSQTKAVAHEYFQRLKDTMGCTNMSVSPVVRVDEASVLEARQYFRKILERAREHRS